MIRYVDGDIQSRKAMKIEALKRMKQLGLREKIINTFKAEDKLLCSDRGKLTDVPPEILKEIREWEDTYGCMAYHVVHNGLYGYEIYNALSVSNYLEDWIFERRLIDNACSMAYTINITKPDYSESGSIQLAKFMGLLMRIG